MFDPYDIIVVGAGHAGCEAAAAAANMGSKVMLITMNMMNMAQMSCNPAMGGIAKGQIVREIDALGGYSGIVSDHSMIQFRMLNKSKGPAMWSPRSQNDRMLFSLKWRKMLEDTPNLDFWQDQVNAIIVDDSKQVKGVTTIMGRKIMAKAVILTNGTFLNGIIHIGSKHYSGGRIGEKSSGGLTENLVRLGFESGRLKTGTPVRVDGRTIDFGKLEEQKGDDKPARFSFSDTPVLTRQRSCYIAYTTEEVHDVLRLGFDESPLFSGSIQGVGPRYCPSIEDKIERFSGKDHHQLFVEPEGWDTEEYYINGFSSSLPEEVQFAALRKIKGFEKAKIFRPGYAIEYDYFPPTQLTYTMETRLIGNLYFAGQINGTTGYEEAAAQGLMAGINAHLKLNKQEPFILKRSEAYIGVLIDDLITKGVDEPYRMFTSRAEYRILLRQNNADLRLTQKSAIKDLTSGSRLEKVKQKEKIIASLVSILKTVSIAPERINPALEAKNSALLEQKVKLASVLLRPEISLQDIIHFIDPDPIIPSNTNSRVYYEALEEAEILIKYEGYIVKEKEIADKLARFEDIKLHPDFDYHVLKSLSTEARQKLSKIKPATIGQASRISGVSPADITVLAIFLGR